MTCVCIIYNDAEPVTLEHDRPRYVKTDDYYTDAEEAMIIAINREKAERKIYRISA